MSEPEAPAAAPAAAPGVFEALRSGLDALPSYTAGSGYLAAGLPGLRSAVAEHYTRRGLPTRAEQVLVTAAVPADVPAVLQGVRVEVRREDHP